MSENGMLPSVCTLPLSLQYKIQDLDLSLSQVYFPDSNLHCRRASQSQPPVTNLTMVFSRTLKYIRRRFAFSTMHFLNLSENVLRRPFLTSAGVRHVLCIWQDVQKNELGSTVGEERTTETTFENLIVGPVERRKDTRVLPATNSRSPEHRVPGASLHVSCTRGCKSGWANGCTSAKNVKKIF
jgi:hypothetical protein